MVMAMATTTTRSSDSDSDEKQQSRWQEETTQKQLDMLKSSRRQKIM